MLTTGESCDLAIVVALPIEASSFVARIKRTHRTRADSFLGQWGVFGSLNVLIATTGAGPARAERAISAILAGHRPACVVAAGLSGGLIPSLALDTIVVGDEVVFAGGTPIAIPPPYVDAVSDVVVGRLLTVDRIIAASNEKQSLGAKHQAIAVDMETYAVAEGCQRLGTPFYAIRAISDTVAEDLPGDMQRLIEQRSLAGQFGAAMGALWRRPASVKDMLRLRTNAVEASERLAEATFAMIPLRDRPA